MLETLRKALLAEAWPEALDHALAAWRIARMPELADLIDRIEARCELPELPTSRVDRQTWWFEHGREPDAITVGALLRVLHERASVLDCALDKLRRRWSSAGQTPLAVRLASNQVLPTNFHERVALLVEWEDDPRIARTVVRVLSGHAIPHSFRLPMLYEVLGDRIAAIGDTRQLEPLASIIAEPRGGTAQLRASQVQFATRARAMFEHHQESRLDRDRLSACIALLPEPPPPAPPPRRADLDGLWAEVAAQPDDVGTRAVLGDALVEAGDPRGDVIFLQCNTRVPNRPLRGTNRETYDGRVKTLLRLEWNNWFGDLALVLPRRACEFRCGMLEVASVGVASSPAWAFAKAKGHRELACLHTVRPGWVTAEDFATFVVALPRFPRTLATSGPVVIDTLAARGAAFDRLRTLELVRDRVVVANDQPNPGWAQLGVAAMPRVAALLPEVRELIVRDHEIARALAPIARTIRRQFPALEHLAIDAPTALIVRDLVVDGTFEEVPAVR